MLDNDGFTRRTYDTILQDLIQQAQNTISPNIATGPDSKIGSLLRVMAYGLAKEEELQESVWFSGYVSQAVGVSLDRLAANIGLIRNPARNAYTTLQVTGKAGAVVPELTRFATKDGIQFMAVQEKTLVATDTATVSEDDIPGVATISAVSVEKVSAANVPSGTITTMIEAVDGVLSVTNTEAATGGTEAESDATLRKRLLDNYKKSANGTVNSILTAVQNVPAVHMAQVIVNNTIEVDSFGNLPKSVHFYVQGGEDSEIANAIFNAIVAGVSTNGKVSVEVPVLGGTRTQTIKFDRPTERKVKVVVKLETTDDFSITGVQDVKTAITDYMSTLRIGETLYTSRLIGAAFEVTGIKNVVLTVLENNAEIQGNSLDPAEFEYIVPEEVEVTV